MANPYAVNATYEGTFNTSSDLLDLNNFARTLTMTSINGIEGIPYQFLPTVDQRIGNNNRVVSGNNIAMCKAIGRKYGQKIIETIPLLFLIPSEPVFMGDFSKDDKKNVIDSLLSGIGDAIDDLVDGTGRYYYAEDATVQYYNYLNPMLTSVAAYLGISEEEIMVGDGSGRTKIGDINWVNDTSANFKTYFNESSSARNLVFYMDSIDSITESFSNDTTQSGLASTINGFSDKAKELDFLLGSGGLSDIKDIVTDVAGNLASGLGEVLGGITGGAGIVKSISNNVGGILNGGKISFPEMWSDSSFDKSFNISIKLRSPDNDTLSIFLNIIKPYCKLLALALPHAIDDDPNIYRTPFLVRAYSKGLFNIDLGIISDMTVTKGAQCAWNDDGLPTQIDIDLGIKDLYKNLSITGYVDDSNSNSFWKRAEIFTRVGQTVNILNNTSYMDFLANMAGLNLNFPAPLRKAKMAYYLGKNQIGSTGSNIYTRFNTFIDSFIAHFYK